MTALAFTLVMSSGQINLLLVRSVVRMRQSMVVINLRLFLLYLLVNSKTSVYVVSKVSCHLNLRSDLEQMANNVLKEKLHVQTRLLQPTLYVMTQIVCQLMTVQSQV